MLSLNTLRTKFGIVLVVFLAIALLSFILGEFKSCTKNEDPEVGTIEANGEVNKVKHSEFAVAYNDAMALVGENNDNPNVDHQANVVATAWDMLKDEHVVIPALNEIGLTVTEEERVAMWNLQSPSMFIQNYFSDRTGFRPDYVQSFKDAVNGGAVNHYVYEVLDKQVVNSRVKEKFVELVVSGAYANKLMLKKGMVAENNTYKGKYVACKYSSIPDEDVEVSQSEIESYYSANLAKYKQEPYRTISYAHFEIEPSDKDREELKKEVDAAAAKFETADLDKYYSSNVSIENNFTSLSSDDEAEALRAGKMYGPVSKEGGNRWYASRVVETKVAPKNFELQHIVLPEEDKALIDSVYTLASAKGADFDALVEKYSILNISEDNKQNVSYSQLPKVTYGGYVNGEILPVLSSDKFAEVLTDAKKNSVVKVENVLMSFNSQPIGECVCITKVLNKGANATHYRLAKMNYEVIASAETRNEIYKRAEKFANEASGSVDNFTKAKTTAMKSSANVVKSAREVQGLKNSLELLRWAYRANVGEVSSVFSLNEGGWVVAVVTAVDDAEHRSVANVSAQIKRELIQQKKAALLKAKMQGATLEEIAANAESKVETFEDVKTTSEIGGDYRVALALESVTPENAGKPLPLVAGNSGVYAIVVDEVAVEEVQTAEAERVKLQAVEANIVANQVVRAADAAVKVVDNTLQHF